MYRLDSKYLVCFSGFPACGDGGLSGNRDASPARAPGAVAQVLD
jgi:hypothetical protein